MTGSRLSHSADSAAVKQKAVDKFMPLLHASQFGHWATAAVEEKLILQYQGMVTTEVIFYTGIEELAWLVKRKRIPASELKPFSLQKPSGCYERKVINDGMLAIKRSEIKEMYASLIHDGSILQQALQYIAEYKCEQTEDCLFYVIAKFRSNEAWRERFEAILPACNNVSHFPCFIGELQEGNDVKISREIFYQCILPRVLAEQARNQLKLYQWVNELYRLNDPVKFMQAAHRWLFPPAHSNSGLFNSNKKVIVTDGVLVRHNSQRKP